MDEQTILFRASSTAKIILKVFEEGVYSNENYSFRLSGQLNSRTTTHTSQQEMNQLVRRNERTFLFFTRG